MAACPSGALVLRSMSLERCPEIREELLISPEQAEQFFRSRRSIRGYKDLPVEKEKLEKLIEWAGYAPSAHNRRPVRLLVLHGREEVSRVAEQVVEWMKGIMERAPSVAKEFHFDRVVSGWEEGLDPVCRSAPCLVFAHADQDARLAQVDCVLTLGYMELAAPVLGLGATWAGYVMAAADNSPRVAKTLDLPKGHKLHGALMIGYPALNFVRVPFREPPETVWRGTNK
jgi:nitroreductase